MNTRPTPETDAALVDHMPKDATEWSEHYLALSIHARKLERERDEAREEIAAMRETIREAHHILSYYRKFAPALADLSEDMWIETTEGKQVISALAKLKPFLP